MLYRSRGLWATANIKRAALQNKSTAFVLGRGTTSVETLCRFPPKGTCAYANPFTPFRFFLKNAVSKKKNCGEILAVFESIIIPCEALCHCERSVAISRKGYRILGKV